MEEGLAAGSGWKETEEVQREDGPIRVSYCHSPQSPKAVPNEQGCVRKVFSRNVWSRNDVFDQAGKTPEASGSCVVAAVLKEIQAAAALSLVNLAGNNWLPARS